MLKAAESNKKWSTTFKLCQYGKMVALKQGGAIMANGKLRERIKSTPEWIKLTLPFVIGLWASPIVQRLFEELYQMNAAVYGNVTYVNIVHYLDTTGDMLLYYLVLTVILIALFAILAWLWSRDSKKTDEAIQEIKTNINSVGKDIKKLLDKENLK